MPDDSLPWVEMNDRPYTIAELKERIGAVVRKAGFSYYSYLLHHWPGIYLTYNASKLSFHNLPDEWRDFYDRVGAIYYDPVFEEARQSRDGKAVVWTIEEMYRRWGHFSPAQRRFVDTAANLELRAGVAIPFRGPATAFSTFTVLYTNSPHEFEKVWRKAESELTRIGRYLYEQSCDRIDRLEALSVVLTPKQTESLLWSARGKTIAETATIMGISRKTVEYHLAQARERLQAVNNTHAVAIAISRGVPPRERRDRSLTATSVLTG